MKEEDINSALDIRSTTIGNSVKLTGLYDYLQLPKESYSRYIESNIIGNKFAESGRDYMETVSKKTSGRPRREFFISGDMAIKLCMIASTEPAERLRIYLIRLFRDRESGQMLSIKEIYSLINMVKVFAFYEYRRKAREKHQSQFYHAIVSVKPSYASSTGNIYREFNKMRNEILNVEQNELNKRFVEYCLLNNRKILTQPTKDEMMIILGEYENIKMAVFDLLMSMEKGKEFAENVAGLAQALAKEIKPMFRVWDERNLFDSPIPENIIKAMGLSHKKLT